MKNRNSSILLVMSSFAFLAFCGFFPTNPSSVVEETMIEESIVLPKTRNVSKEGLVLLTYYEGFHLVELQFSKELVSPTGKVTFYRPFDKRKKIAFPIRVDCENVMDIFIRELEFGKWTVEVDWQTSQTKYLNEFNIEIPISIDKDVLTIL